MPWRAGVLTLCTDPGRRFGGHESPALTLKSGRIDLRFRECPILGVVARREAASFGQVVGDDRDPIAARRRSPLLGRLCPADRLA